MRRHNKGRYRSGLEKEVAAYLRKTQKKVRYAKLYKGAKSRYCHWCEQHKFQWAHRVIPEDWLKEKGKEITVKKIELKTKRKT